MTGRELASPFFDLLILPRRKVPELGMDAYASPPSLFVSSRAKANILLPAPSFFFRVPVEDSECREGVEVPGPTGDLRSVSEFVASLAARSCLLGTQLVVESLEGALESCCAEAKEACAGDEEPL